MNVLAIQSSGNETSLCVILGDDVLEYSISHQRKDRPNWQEMLSQIGLDSFFFIDDIDIEFIIQIIGYCISQVVCY